MSEESLIPEIRRWIESSKDPAADLKDLVAEGHRLVAECHQRMLACEGHDPLEGAAHAVAGMELIRQLRATELPLPDWLDTHEEQFCRYGGIWIHQCITSGLPTEPRLCADGIQLLDRLAQIHRGSFSWILNLRRDLSDHLVTPSQDDQGDLRVVVVGNCQAFPLSIGLQKALPAARIFHCPSVHLATPQDVQRLHQRLGNTDLLVMHRVMPGYRNNIGLDSATLRGLLPTSARSLILPNIHYEGHHPWIGYAHDPDGRLADIEHDSPLGPYHDFLAMAAARDGIPLDRLLDPTCPPSILESLHEQHHRSLKELERREADCDLALSDWIALHHQDIPLAHTINHPTQAVLNELLRRLLTLLNLPSCIDASPQDSTEHLGALSIPIHPWVRQALGLNPWSQSWGQRQGITWSIEQQLQQSLDFYQRHPWIAAANSQDPKLLLAEQLLKDSFSGAGLASQRKEPSVAALINYFNDEDMLAWQLKLGCLDHYDRIYIWDGPYSSTQILPLFHDESNRLESTELGQQLLADSRVIYRYREWRDEAEKRIDAYTAIQEDLIVLHDTDEFFRIDRDLLKQFWDSPHHVGAQRTQNLYAGGLRGSDDHHAGDKPENLPLKRVVFRKAEISPKRHLDYCWLVGIEQSPTDESIVHPVPLWHTYHLTACRTARGQAAKMSFYMCLSISKTGHNWVVQRLEELVQASILSISEARDIFYRGDPGFTGLPNPAFGLRLAERICNPSFPQAFLEDILAEVNCVGAGSYNLLDGYPLYFWIAKSCKGNALSIRLKGPGFMNLRMWEWNNNIPSSLGLDLACKGDSVSLSLPWADGLLGRLFSLTIDPGVANSPLHSVEISVG